MAYFRYLELAVGPGVFIPRPETESVVQLVIDHIRDAAHPRVVDLGTGSGAIAGSIAAEVPAAEVHAVEYSAFARVGGKEPRAPGVNLVQGDLRTALPELNGTFDVVVSNPPYIPAEAIPNEPEVALHDPPEALYGGGADGMELPTAAAASAARLLRPGGYFVMEHAEVQSGWIAAMLARQGTWTGITSHQDLNGKDRATSLFGESSQFGMKEWASDHNLQLHHGRSARSRPGARPACHQREESGGVPDGHRLRHCR